MEIEAWRGNVELKMIQADPTAATQTHHELGRNVDMLKSLHKKMMLHVILNIYTKMDTCREKQPEEVRHSL